MLQHDAGCFSFHFIAIRYLLRRHYDIIYYYAAAATLLAMAYSFTLMRHYYAIRQLRCITLLLHIIY